MSVLREAGAAVLSTTRIGGYRSPLSRGRRVWLPQQHRIGTVDFLGAVDHGSLQRGRLHRNVFGKKSCQRDIALRVAVAEIARGQRLAGQPADAECRSE